MIQIEKETIQETRQVNYYLIVDGVKTPITQIDFEAKETFLNNNVADIDFIDVDINNNLIVKPRI